jgi:threonine dehydrogenase-like Zn-dependent dehydrogenase
MKAFVMREIGETDIIEKQRPTPGPTDAILKPTKGLICTSDCHTFHGAIGEREDLTLGHEVVGVVDEVGDAVSEFEGGDRVAVGAITPDWNSLAAQDGHPSQSNEALGGWKFANVKDGTFAEYVHVNDADGNLAHIPDGVSDHEATYVADMLSTGFTGAERADIPMGGTVAVFAQGPVGLMATRGARLQGAGEVIAVETMEPRKELAREYGVSHTSIGRDFDALAEYVAQNLDRDHTFIMDRVLRGAVRNLVEDGKHYKAVKAAERLNAFSRADRSQKKAIAARSTMRAATSAARRVTS